MSGVLVAGTSDGTLGFIDVKTAQLLQVKFTSTFACLQLLLSPTLLQVERALALRVTRLFVPDGCDSGGLGSGTSPQSSCFSIHTVVAADSAGGGTWVGALDYSDPTLLALGLFPAPNFKTHH
jgi:hypothetical protein